MYLVLLSQPSRSLPLSLLPCPVAPVCFLGAAEVAHLIVEHDTLYDGLVDASQDLLINLEMFQMRK